ncbi:yjeF N-terminal domain-containing protein 3 [Rhinopithecus roxellana]|uniref:yjeF N-terminal domain-containing protein 3 n=1 Tax=Rhinopithecus roxellana TaxID=61622 RepID=UPI00123713D3|nr:yjeF N-terminal domain-containing protein 3 [Rhinopithecus roxellana]
MDACFSCTDLAEPETNRASASPTGKLRPQEAQPLIQNTLPPALSHCLQAQAPSLPLLWASVSSPGKEESGLCLCLCCAPPPPHQAFPLPALSRKQRTVLVVCGPEQNGAVGLVCARHLRVFEYEPTIFYPMRSLDLLHRDLTTQCEKMDIPFLSYLPTEVQLINEAYGLVVDAVLGPGVEPGEVGGPCTRALATLKLLSIPLVSLDIPSGWDAETGSDAEDGLRPDVLVSLAAPKRCAGRFSGRHHFVAGRFVPDDVRRKFALRLPGYTGTDCVAAL